ncbi:MAG: ferritin-like domain-containing protein [Zunongwangia sp.]|mgnify:FL=1|uniref:Ribonucleotide reductase-like protein n=2 Tax=Zunongwangia profunda TaxID=398743 RepID=D5BCG9_ZUNPS|nr:ferritin-like domain-containing protein [Zunongwangia profunda]MAG88145.1 ferritin-like domain-containing protein [Flavobacteriaceae bacterium]MAO37644.1 ferritin-like domain-containing protein [Zunongwangia sp.]ADF54795.1 ribonucleotide reductase-like protein [Zunongwangia profunda SM-A87]MAS71640.1 ferritin-like domain-containing protein [Zunongwangia sp.]MCC4226704.1 ferritin-like domain-containing protein [Zunongwangia profunda]|tara:strand:+ start:371 stop:856 length:486 start_codon:yes stop_codon:yes gene_type:complete
MENLQDLFKHQLKDLYSAETQLIKALPKMVKAAKNEKLKKAFQDHLEETKEHKERLSEICKELGIKPTGETCKAMKGLIEEAEDFLKEKTTDEVNDAGIIADAQRIEHYEISGYGTVVRYAKELGYKELASKLQKTLDQEYNADNTLDKLAEKRLNKKAVE